MPLPDSAGEYWLGQQRIAAATLAVAKRLWLRMGRSDFDASWERMAPTLVATVEQAQLASAGLAAEFVPTVLDEQGINIDPVAEIAVESFVGVTGGGVDLASAFQSSVIQAKVAVAEGRSVPDALATGGEYLQMLVQTVLSDTGRAAESVGIAARPGTGYVRMLNPPSCSRCAILAGRFYRYNADFERHPRCDCRQIASTEDHADEISVNPRAYFDSLTPKEQEQVFTVRGAEAIRLGADLSQVVNARSGMSTAQVNLAGWIPKGRLTTKNVYGQQIETTDAGTTRRGIAYKAMLQAGYAQRQTDVRLKGEKYFRAKAPRLMPESIMRIADDRADAIRLLKLNGYILENGGPAALTAAKASTVALDELLDVPLYQLPSVDLDRVIASGRVVASPPVVRPNPPVQMSATLADASPRQILDTAAGLAAHMRRELNQRERSVDRATPLNPVAYDLPQIADDVLEAGMNVQPLEYRNKPVIDRGETTAMLEVLFGMNRSYESNSPFSGVKRTYTATSIDSGDGADALRIAVALKHLDRSDIEFDQLDLSKFIRNPGYATAPTLIDDILADGLNVEHLIARDILPDVDAAIRGRLDELIAAAKVKDDAVLAASNAVEAAAAKAQWAANTDKTGAPFKGYLTNYRGTDAESVSVNKLHDISYGIHRELDSNRHYYDSKDTVADFDMRAVTDEIIERRLNMVNDGNFDNLEEAEIERTLLEILNKHRRVTTPDRRAMTLDVDLPARKPKDVKGQEFVDSYADFAAAASELDFEFMGMEPMREVFESSLKRGLNARLITDPDVPAEIKNAAKERFWRIANEDLDEDGYDVLPSTPSLGAAPGISVAREPAVFSNAEPVIPEIDNRIGFMHRLQFENDFLAVPFAARQVLADRGVRVVASRRVSEGPFASMFDGITSADGRVLDEISFYQNQIKAVVISTDAPHGSVNVVAHEVGHALDSNTLKGNPIQVVWQEQGNPNLPPPILKSVQEPVPRTVEKFVQDPYVKWAHTEYIRDNPTVNGYYREGSEGTDLSGREEWIAEGYAALVQGNSAQLSAISGGSREAMDILQWTFRRMGVLP